MHCTRHVKLALKIQNDTYEQKNPPLNSLMWEAHLKYMVNIVLHILLQVNRTLSHAVIIQLLPTLKDLILWHIKYERRINTFEGALPTLK